MTKKEVIDAIEGDGHYYHVKIDKNGKVTGVAIDEPSHYQKSINKGGRKFLGYDTELLAALSRLSQ